MTRFTDRSLFTLIIFVIILLFVVLSFQYRPKARLVPLAIGIPTLILALVQLLIDTVPAVARRFRFLQEYEVLGIKPANASEPSGEQRARIQDRMFPRELGFAAWLLSLMVLIYGLGYLVAIPVFVCLFLRLWAFESWAMSLAIAFGTWAFVYVVFIAVMHAPLHSGILFQAFGG